jgi:hypothetical protein
MRQVLTIDNVSATAVDLNALNAATSGVVTASTAVTISGTAADIQALITATSSAIVLAGAAAYTVSDSTSTAATVLNDLNSGTTGTVTANSIPTITGTLNDLTTTLVTDTATTILNNPTVTVSDPGTLDATNTAKLEALNAKTSGLISALNVESIAGDAVAIGNAIATGIALRPSVAIDASSETGPVAATVLSGFDTYTSGLVNAIGVTAITGTIAEIKAVTDHAGTSGNAISLGSSVALTATANAVDVLASTLKNFNLLTTGLVDVTAATKITGTSLEVKSVTDASVPSGDGIKFGSAVPITITGNVTLADLVSIDSKTTGAVTFNAVARSGDSDANSTSGTKLLTTGGTIDIATGDFVTGILTGNTVTTTNLSVVNVTTASTLKFVNNANATLTSVDSTLTDGVADNSVTFVPGTYVSGAFEYSSGGVDALVIADVDSATDGQLYEAIVLVGGGATHTHTAASGLFTFA